MSKETGAKIDKIVDDLVVDDAVARKLKTKLHAQIDAKSSSAAVRDTADEDTAADDLWDNLPI